MPTRRWIDGKNAVSFKLVHRQQNDPLVHDPSAPAMVLAPGLSGPADGAYDYRQHLREPGSLGSGTVVVAATPAAPATQHGRPRASAPSLEEALGAMDLARNRPRLRLDQEILPSNNLRHLSYQSQQDVPDCLAGLQPDMDPDVREVMEALEDDAYVDNDDDRFFSRLADDDDASDDGDGWESDATEKPPPTAVDAVPGDRNPDWLSDFEKFKRRQALHPVRRDATNAASRIDRCTDAGLSSILTGSAVPGGRRKKRKGALTNPSTYSMTSSSLARTEHQRILDDRFEVTVDRWDAEIDDRATRTTATGSGPARQREDFDAIVDEFLAECDRGPVRRGRGSAYKSAASRAGLSELDEVRRVLRPPPVVSASGPAAREGGGGPA